MKEQSVVFLLRVGRTDIKTEAYGCLSPCGGAQAVVGLDHLGPPYFREERVLVL